MPTFHVHFDFLHRIFFPSTSPAGSKDVSLDNVKKLTPIEMFAHLHTDAGVGALRAWFKTFFRSGEDPDVVGDDKPVSEIDEYQFADMLQLLCEISDIEVLDMFDVLDYKKVGVIGFQEIYLVCVFLTALEAGESSKLLFYHGQALFDMLTMPPHKELTADEFKKLGRMLGFKERKLSLLLRDILVGSEGPQTISYQDFERLYFCLFQDYDFSNGNAMLLPAVSGDDLLSNEADDIIGEVDAPRYNTISPVEPKTKTRVCTIL
eukprot:GILJ01010143.1.p1 GENE.GILJ01010143.1~~GILJ01010143.1.p1  ORF type:complete len:284 (-),score=40.72 GILJ01010143.1:316-1104(-)